MRLLLDIMGPVGLLQEGSPGAVLAGRIEHEFRKCQINTFGAVPAVVLRDRWRRSAWMPGPTLRDGHRMTE